MTTILVPVDGSDSSVNALKTAIKWGKKSNWTLHVITVQPPILLGNPALYVAAETIDQYYQEAGTETLNLVKPLLNESGLTYQTAIKTGPVAQEIAEYANNNGIDQLIMGTRGLGSVTGLLLGSITTKVLTLVHVPVTLVK
jgi:nucleotide-binding universal stress UspA family protein